MTRDVLPPSVSGDGNIKASFDLSKESLQKLRAGNTMEAIKIVRESTGLGLAEAAKVVEMIRRQMPADGSDSGTLGIVSAMKIAAAASRPAERLAPGQVATSGGMGKWVILIAIAGVAIAAALYF